MSWFPNLHEGKGAAGTVRSNLSNLCNQIATIFFFCLSFTRLTYEYRCIQTLVQGMRFAIKHSLAQDSHGFVTRHRDSSSQDLDFLQNRKNFPNPPLFSSLLFPWESSDAHNCLTMETSRGQQKPALDPRPSRWVAQRSPRQLLKHHQPPPYLTGQRGWFSRSHMSYYFWK